MSNDKIQIALDKVIYDKDIGMSIIEGWAFNTLTMEPVNITSNYPALINTVYRLDLNRNINITNNTAYGFFILIPGDYRKKKPVITLESYPFKKEIKLAKRMKFPIAQKLGNLRSYLVNHGLLKDNSIPDEELEKLRKAYAEDELKEWMETIEPETFSPEASIKSNLSYILTAKDEAIDDTVESIKLTNPDGEIIIVSEEDINIPEYEVISKGNTDKTLIDLKNEAINKAKGDYIVFIDQKDTLAPEFYNEVNYALETKPNTDFIYSDSDLIDGSGRRYDLNFKPDFDEVLLTHSNYILNPVIIKKDLLQKIGGFRNGFEGLKDYDLILRATKAADNIIHIPHILYHWNKSTEGYFNLIRKDSHEGITILDDYLRETPLKTGFSETDFVYNNILKEEYPSLTIICGILKGFSDKGMVYSIKNILDACDYPNYQILAVNIEEFTDNSKIKFIKDKSAKTITELFNKAARAVDTKYVLFVDSPIKGVVGSWLNEMVDLIEQKEVGIVGPKFFNSNFTYDSLGIGIDENKQYSIGKDTYIQTKGFNNSWLIPKEVFAVTNGALLIDRKLFEDLGGFDTTLQPSNQYIDLSIRARDYGYKTVNARNTPVLIEDLKSFDNYSIEELLQKFGQEALVDSTENINIKPSGSAKPFLKEK